MQPYAGAGQQTLQDIDPGCDTNGDLRHHLRYAVVEHTHPMDTLVKEEAGIRIRLLVVSLSHRRDGRRWYVDSRNKGGGTGRGTAGSLQEL